MSRESDLRSIESVSFRIRSTEGEMRTSLIAFGVLLLASVPGFAADPADWEGVKLLPKERCDIKIENQVLDHKHFPLPYVVHKVNGEWLWIGGAKKGWVHRNQVLTLDEAPAYYTEVINRRDNWLVWAYAKRALAWTERGELDSAIADYGQLTQYQPNTFAYFNRGKAWNAKKEYDNAIADFSQVIQVQPNAGGVYSNRGIAWLGKKDYDKAIADFNEAIRLDPNDINAYSGRGDCCYAKKEYERAIADYNEAIRLDPNLDSAYNSVAWIHATSSDENYRNGTRAVEVATKACEMTGWTNAYRLGTLAAAYAEVGDFENAIKFQNKAIELKPNDAMFVKSAMKRLQLYTDGKPFRETSR